MSFSGFGGADDSTDNREGGEENRRGFVALRPRSSVSAVSEAEGKSLSSLASVDVKVSVLAPTPPWVWSLVPGEPRDCLCIAREIARTKERGFAVID